jgi:hypothetical protein
MAETNGRLNVKPCFRSKKKVITSIGVIDLTSDNEEEIVKHPTREWGLERFRFLYNE